VRDSTKSRIRQLYQFLKEANQLRFRPVRGLAEQPKVVRLADMPNHPAMQLLRPVRTDNTQEVPDTLLRVKRPPLTKCPAPPASIVTWLLPSWDDPAKTVSVAESQNATDDEGQTITIRFDDDPQRVADFEAWAEQRKAWIEPERIDMVVEGAGKRLAIECDGDRYHPMEKLEDDMARQAILERLGWRFVRIRGSAFYRNPELAMRPVFDRLGELEISQEVTAAEAPASDMTLIHELDDVIRKGTGPEEAPAGMKIADAEAVQGISHASDSTRLSRREQFGISKPNRGEVRGPLFGNETKPKKFFE
jgi:very-short-patch-repair endonuclease